MHIIGRGFLGSQFSRCTDKYSDVLMFSAGVSNSLCEDGKEFRREADLLYSAVMHCRKHDMRLVYFSSAGMVYGNYESEVTESGPVFPRSAYGRHKLAMESVLRASDIRYLILRLSNPVGPTQKSHQLVPALVEQVRRGFVEIWRGAHRDLIDVLDVVELTNALLETGCVRETFNLASGKPVAVEALVDHIEQRLDKFVLRNAVNRGDSYHVRIDKLISFLGVHVAQRFPDGYYQNVIERYLDALHDSQTEQTASPHSSAQ